MVQNDLETGIGAFFSPKYKSRYGVQENGTFCSNP